MYKAKTNPNPVVPVSPGPQAATMQVVRERGEVVVTSYDNEADDGATCVCTLTFSNHGTATGSAPRSEDLAADQRAAYYAALQSIG